MRRSRAGPRTRLPRPKLPRRRPESPRKPSRAGIETRIKTRIAEQRMTNAEWDRIPVVISFAEAKQMVETYGFAGSQGLTVLEGQRLVPRGKPSDTVFLFMHPATTLH